jgi:hypothetical protein
LLIRSQLGGSYAGFGFMHFVSGSGHIVLMGSASVPARLGVTAKRLVFFHFFVCLVGLMVSLARSLPIAAYRGRLLPAHRGS